MAKITTAAALAAALEQIAALEKRVAELEAKAVVAPTAAPTKPAAPTGPFRVLFKKGDGSEKPSKTVFPDSAAAHKAAASFNWKAQGFRSYRVVKSALEANAA